MPRKNIDSSQPSYLLDLTLPDHIKTDDIMEIAHEFAIEDRNEFLESFQIWAVAYRNNKVRYRQAATPAQRRDSAARIREKANELITLMQDTGVDTINSLRYFNPKPSSAEFSDAEILEYIREGVLEEFGQSYEFDIRMLHRHLCLLSAVAGQSTEHAISLTDNGHTKHPGTDMDRKVFMSNMYEYVDKRLAKKFSRNFVDEPYDGENDVEYLRVPNNWCSQFVTRCAQLVDPTLSVDTIERMMKDKISSLKQHNT